MWASRHILQLLHERFGYAADASILNEDLFRKEEYPSWFLGSQGKKVTLALEEPDDFSLFYPLYSTEIHFAIPEANIDCSGDFSVFYNMDEVEERDYYHRNPYGAYIYGDWAFERIENKQADNEIRAVIVHDSFGNCVLPFLSMGIKDIDSVDLRLFTGSLERYIEDTNPDIVVIFYNPTRFSRQNAANKSVFHFR